MKWFVPLTAATCAAALVVMLPLAHSGTSSPTRDEDTLDSAPSVCVGEPPWFAPIHKAYDCNPRITPDFNFASLYSPDVNRLEASFTEAAASVTNRIGDLKTFQLINTGRGTVSGFGTATVVVGITQDRSATPCGPGSWTNAATRRIVLDEGVLIVREASIACPTASGPVINGTYEVDGQSSTGMFAGARGSGDLTVDVSSAKATISGKLKLAGSSDD